MVRMLSAQSHVAGNSVSPSAYLQVPNGQASLTPRLQQIVDTDKRNKKILLIGGGIAAAALLIYFITKKK